MQARLRYFWPNAQRGSYSGQALIRASCWSAIICHKPRFFASPVHMKAACVPHVTTLAALLNGELAERNAIQKPVEAGVSTGADHGVLAGASIR